MKKFTIVIALVLAAAMVFAFAACSKPNAPENNNEVNNNTEIAEKTEEAAFDGDVYNTGKFSVNVPKGWTAVAVPDLFDETKIDEYSVYLVAQDSVDDIDEIIFSSDVLYITINYTEPDGFFFEPTRDYYSDIEDVSVNINGADWTGFTGRLVNPTLIIWNERADGSFVQANISNYQEGVLESEDVRSILSSVK